MAFKDRTDEHRNMILNIDERMDKSFQHIKSRNNRRSSSEVEDKDVDDIPIRKRVCQAKKKNDKEVVEVEDEDEEDIPIRKRARQAKKKNIKEVVEVEGEGEERGDLDDREFSTGKICGCRLPWSLVCGLDS